MNVGASYNQGRSLTEEEDAFMPVGRAEEFKESQKDFANYIERLERWMLANDIEDGKKVVVFLQ